ncbi:E3 ubiquitin-protein ligase HECTD3 [Nothoprocta perdicaria]|uniref:E3 ubiquitin-protein ligase HECTD3 n=1 Tax=Nothoprocta perdicaria TaxID=30464 RepID=UPI000E1C300F|nr:E3 ubiquitin-protein ligase HECTD3 [Nothoprocta perdicaria]
MRAGAEAPHQVLGRLRFLLQCSECFRGARPLPAALCYVPREVQYKICKDPAGAAAAARSLLSVWDSPGPARGGKRAARATIEVRKGGCLRATGEEYCNGAGLWVKLSKEQLQEHKGCHDLEEGWLLAQKFGEAGDKLVPVESVERMQWQQQMFGVDYKPAVSWEQVVDLTYSTRLGGNPRFMDQDEAAVQKLRSLPASWSYECDLELARFLYDHSERELKGLDCMKEHVNSLDVSSQAENFNASHLTDGRTDTFWESEGPQGEHWVRLYMKKGSIIKKLWLLLESQTLSYIPRRVAVYGGELNRLQHLRSILISENSYRSVCVLRNMKIHLPVVEIRILECRDGGYNVRLQGIKIKSFWEWDLVLNVDMFRPARLVRYPLLEGVDRDTLYRRAVLIQRFITLLDSVLLYLIPIPDQSVGTFSQLRSIKPFLPLSKHCSALLAQYMQDSQSPAPHTLPKVYINRYLARDHRANPALDPSCKNAIFTQLYEGLRTSGKNQQPMDYRWPSSYTQWWECDFISEGIVDNGGGFRDSLADVSEELCPSSGDVAVPLPFFVRTSNQGAGDNRDVYVPNPSCKDFPKYEWIGQLMGAALRGKEFLVLALPGLVWKQLTGEEVSWRKDFADVDSELVKLLEVLQGVDREAFDFMFGRELTYTTVLSDQRVVELIPNGSSTVVRYEDRREFIRLVQKARLEESKEQIAAIRAGLFRVVPQAMLDLLPWQEVEKMVCGEPEITVTDLRKHITFEEFPSKDPRVEMFLEALNNFTSRDLSRFLKFVTGRSRLPVQITIYPDRTNSHGVDLMPEASTCSSIFYLPTYSSAKACEELLRYAIYNCMSIDTDKNTWDE